MTSAETPAALSLAKEFSGGMGVSVIRIQSMWVAAVWPEGSAFGDDATEICGDDPTDTVRGAGDQVLHDEAPLHPTVRSVMAGLNAVRPWMQTWLSTTSRSPGSRTTARRRLRVTRRSSSRAATESGVVARHQFGIEDQGRSSWIATQHAHEPARGSIGGDAEGFVDAGPEASLSESSPGLGDNSSSTSRMLQSNVAASGSPFRQLSSRWAGTVGVEGGLGVELELDGRRGGGLLPCSLTGREQVLHEVAAVLGLVPDGFAEGQADSEEDELAQQILAGRIAGVVWGRRELAGRDAARQSRAPIGLTSSESAAGRRATGREKVPTLLAASTSSSPTGSVRSNCSKWSTIGTQSAALVPRTGI